MPDTKQKFRFPVPAQQPEDRDNAQATHELLREILKAVSPTKAKFINVYERSDVINTPQMVKAEGTILHGWYLFNNAATVRSVKIFDKGSLAVVGTDKPKLNFVLPAGGGANIMAARSIEFVYGLCVAITTGVGDYDNTAGVANDVVMNLFWE